MKLSTKRLQKETEAQFLSFWGTPDRGENRPLSRRFTPEWLPQLAVFSSFLYIFRKTHQEQK
jgi:hypothetical protein